MSNRLCYLVVDDLECEPADRQGTLVVLRGSKPSRRTRDRAIEIVRSLWEEDRLPLERFANGITEESIVTISETDPSETLLPVERGASELCQLLSLQVAHQVACKEARPLVSLVQAVLEDERSLSADELGLASDRKTGKILQKVAATCADLARFRESMSGDARLVLEIIRADRGDEEPEVTDTGATIAEADEISKGASGD
ncbi:MAG: hypothetical protein ACFB9N_08610 [Geitlerinemataceae cyanobacterium]